MPTFAPSSPRPTPAVRANSPRAPARACPTRLPWRLPTGIPAARPPFRTSPPMRALGRQRARDPLHAQLPKAPRLPLPLPHEHPSHAHARRLRRLAVRIASLFPPLSPEVRIPAVRTNTTCRIQSTCTTTQPRSPPRRFSEVAASCPAAALETQRLASGSTSRQSLRNRQTLRFWTTTTASREHVIMQKSNATFESMRTRSSTWTAAIALVGTCLWSRATKESTSQTPEPRLGLAGAQLERRFYP